MLLGDYLMWETLLSRLGRCVFLLALNKKTDLLLENHVSRRGVHGGEGERAGFLLNHDAPR